MTTQSDALPRSTACRSFIDQPLSVGVFDILPTEIMVSILSLLKQPLAVAPVCRAMKDLAVEAVHTQLVTEGVSARSLSQRWEISVNPICLDILRRHQIDVKAFIAKDKQTALPELGLLLDRRFELLNRPNDLHAFLNQRLLQNSLQVAEYFYGPGFIDRPQPVMTPPAWLVNRCPSLVSLVASRSLSTKSDRSLPTQSLPTRRPEERMRDLVASLREREIQKAMPVLVVRGEESVTSPTPAVPVQILSLPPVDVLRLLNFNRLPGEKAIPLSGLRVDGVSFIPSQIGSLGGIHTLMIHHSSIRTIPSEVAQLPLEVLWIENCPHLESLPESLRSIPTLKTRIFDNCPKLKQE